MSWLAKLLAIRSVPVSTLDLALRESLSQSMALPPADLLKTHFETRYIIVNTEATGPNVSRDRHLAIAAIAVERSIVVPADSYYAKLEQDPVTALTNLITFVGNNPVVVFNSVFNRVMLESSLERSLGVMPAWEWLDLYTVLAGLFPELASRPIRLENWMRLFRVETFQRHHALGDAFVIAQLFMIAQARACARGMLTPRSLIDFDGKQRREQKL